MRNSSRLPVLLILLGGIFADSPITAQGEADANATRKTWDLRVAKVEGRKLAVDLQLDAKGQLVMSGSGGSRGVPLKQKVVIRCADWYRRVGEGKHQMSRRYVRYDKTENREITDPGLAGFTIEFDQQGDRFLTGPAGDTKVSVEARDSQFSRCTSIGGWLPMPEAAEIGKAFEVDFAALAPFVLDLKDWSEEARAVLTLDSVDEEKGRAALTGEIRVVAKEGDGRGVLTSRFEGPCKMSFDLEEKTISSLEWSGEAQAEGVMLERPVTIKGSFKLKLGVRGGSTGRSAAKARPKIRNSARKVGKYKVAAAVPSHYVDNGDSSVRNGGWVFHSCLDGEARRRVITLWSMRNQDPKAVMEGAAASSMTDAASFKPKQSKVSTKIGKGISVSYVDEDDVYMETVFIATKERIARVRLYVPKKKKSAGQRDLKAVLSSLRVTF